MSEQRGAQGWPGFMRPSRAPRTGGKTMHTAFHVMEAMGYFEGNPANAGARDDQGLPLYTGPVEYPKMFYHPTGEERITVPGEWIEQSGNRGPKLVGEQREIITQVARSKEEEEQLRADGWWDHPAKAIEVAVTNPDSRWYKKAVPSMGADTRIRGLENEVERLKKALEEAQALGAKVTHAPKPKPELAL